MERTKGAADQRGSRLGVERTKDAADQRDSRLGVERTKGAADQCEQIDTVTPFECVWKDGRVPIMNTVHKYSR
jgi:hypothetical protein